MSSFPKTRGMVSRKLSVERSLILEAKYQQLDRVMWRICESKAGLQLFWVKNQDKWEQAIERIEQLFEELIAYTSSLPELNRCFNRDPLVRFMQDLYRYSQRRRLPIGTTLTVIDMQKDILERRIVIETEDIRKIKWSAPATRFLNAAGSSIDLRSTLLNHHTRIQACSHRVGK